MELEHYEQSKEGGIRFVEDIFRDMGGKVLPPMRPRHRYGSMTPTIDAFMMDFENSCLENNWNNSIRVKGPTRHENAEWAAMIQSHVFPKNSEIDWQEYVDWVRNGGGDEWFQEDDDETRLEFLLERDAQEFEQDFLAGYLESQTRLRTSYACKELVRPLSTPLDARIVAMAGILNGQ